MYDRIKFCTAILILTCSFPFNSIAQTIDSTKSKINKIAIDAGFGGTETGPSGCAGRLFAKDVNLIIAQKLKNKLVKTLGIEIIMTRTDDTFISLEERAYIANMNNIDLLISIQTNGSPESKACGIETYYLNLIKDSIPAHSDSKDNLHTILDDMALNSRIEISKRLAREVQNSVSMRLAEKYNKIKNRGIKQAPFYLLVGAQMPSIMIQTSFITNQRECERLQSEDYQNEIVEGIAKGVKKFIEEETINRE